jgi:hypothetical protein
MKSTRMIELRTTMPAPGAGVARVRQRSGAHCFGVVAVLSLRLQRHQQYGYHGHIGGNVCVARTSQICGII